MKDNNGNNRNESRFSSRLSLSPLCHRKHEPPQLFWVSGPAHVMNERHAWCSNHSLWEGPGSFTAIRKRSLHFQAERGVAQYDSFPSAALQLWPLSDEVLFWQSGSGVMCKSNRAGSLITFAHIRLSSSWLYWLCVMSQLNERCVNESDLTACVMGISSVGPVLGVVSLWLHKRNINQQKSRFSYPHCLKLWMVGYFKLHQRIRKI